MWFKLKPHVKAVVWLLKNDKSGWSVDKDDAYYFHKETKIGIWKKRGNLKFYTGTESNHNGGFYSHMGESVQIKGPWAWMKVSAAIDDLYQAPKPPPVAGMINQAVFKWAITHGHMKRELPIEQPPEDDQLTA